MLGFTVALSLLTGIIFGLAPAWRSTKVDLTPALKDSGRGSSAASRSLLSRGLVVLQVGLSLLLLVGAGLFLRTLVNLQGVDPGFNTRNLLLFGITRRLSLATRMKSWHSFISNLAERLEILAGSAESHLFNQYLAFQWFEFTQCLFARCADRSPPDAEGRIKSSGTGYVNHVRENFLEAMEIPLLAGRSLRSQDDASARSKVVVVNQTFANKYFPNENPIGKRFTFDSPRNPTKSRSSALPKTRNTPASVMKFRRPPTSPGGRNWVQ